MEFCGAFLQGESAELHEYAARVDNVVRTAFMPQWLTFVDQNNGGYNLEEGEKLGTTVL